MKPSAVVVALLIVIMGCTPNRTGATSEGIEPATPRQVEQITQLLEEDLRVQNVYRVRSADHKGAWYVAGRVYGAGAIDGDVAVWFVGGEDRAARLLAVDTMADACSYAPVEAEAALSWADAEVKRLEAYVGSRI